MPSDGVKQKKTKTGAVSNNTENRETQRACEGDEEKKDGEVQSQRKAASGRASSCSSVDIRTIVSLLSLTASFVLAWVILQQNAKLNEAEKKYKHLYGKAGDLLALEKKFSAVSEKLEASEDHLKGALSSFSALSKLQNDITSLNSIITAMREDQSSSSHRLQSVNERFLNVTETWQGGLAIVTEDLSTLRSESRTVHGRVTERVNEAEERLHALSQRLEELEDSSRRNGRVLERTEEEDAKSVQNQLDWNTRQVTVLQEQLKLMSKKDEELEEKLVETEPRAKQCETQLPIVEDAVRSILRLGADLSGVERRIEELTLQVFGTEDSMLRALAEILELQQTLSELQVDTSAMKVRSELGDVLDAVKELNRVQRRLEMDYGTEESELDKEEGMDTFEMKQLNDLEKHGFPESAGDHSESTTTEDESK